MKTTGPNPPPPLAAAFGRLVSVGAAGGAAAGTARTRRAARYTKPKTTRSRTNAALWSLCVDMALWYAENNRLPYSVGFARDRYREAVARSYPSQYWTPVAATTSRPITSTPTSTLDPSPPSYAYRDPLNQPTIPAYPTGTPGGGAPAYAGATTGTEFADITWTWAAYDFPIPDTADATSLDRALLSLAYTLTVAASDRPSRPMYSLAARLRAGVEGDAWIDGTAPPIEPSSVYYTRYRPPATTPPYYTGAKTDTLHVAAQLLRDPLATDPADTVSLAIGPRPMFGRGYNNNTQVDTSLQILGTPLLILPKLSASTLPWVEYQSDPVRYWHPASGKTFSPPRTVIPAFYDTWTGLGALRATGAAQVIRDYGGRDVAVAARPAGWPGDGSARFFDETGAWIIYDRTDPVYPYAQHWRLDKVDYYGNLLSTSQTDTLPHPWITGGAPWLFHPTGIMSRVASTDIYFQSQTLPGIGARQPLPSGAAGAIVCAGRAWATTAAGAVHSAPLPPPSDLSNPFRVLPAMTEIYPPATVYGRPYPSALGALFIARTRRAFVLSPEYNRTDFDPLFPNTSPGPRWARYLFTDNL